MAKKSALGRGIGALIPDADKEMFEKKIEVNRDIPINSIEPNPFQPRTSFDEQALEELSMSISKLGVVQPLTVRDMGSGKFQLIAGERRWRAAKMAGLTTVPAFIRATTDDQTMLEMALVENIQREDLDAIEVAISFQRLIEECNLTQEQMSERVGKQRSTVSNYLRLLKLPPEIQLGLRNKVITMGHARSLIGIDDDKERMKIYYRIKDEELSVRQTEDMVRRLHSVSAADVEKKAKHLQLEKDYSLLADQLNLIFSTPVSVKINAKGKGQIIIPFNGSDDMERIISIFDNCISEFGQQKNEAAIE